MTFSIWSYILLLLAWGTIPVWLVGLWWTLRCLRGQNLLSPLTDNAPDDECNAALVSILLPARNEEHRILETCVRSLLRQDYSNFEIIAIDDRSTDRTGEILHQLARDNGRLRVVDGVEPLDGWLGKPHALAQGLERARGEWILTTDADIVYTPTAIRTTLTYVSEKQVDALTLIPHTIWGSFWERVFMPTFGWFCLLAMPTHRVNDSARPETLGVGNFFLIRRESLRKIENFNRVKSEVAEDLKLAELLKASGARIHLGYAPDLISTRMYAGLGEIWQGFTKNLFAGSKFSLAGALFNVWSIIVLGALPAFVALFLILLWLVSRNTFLLWLVVPLIVVYALQILIIAFVMRSWGGFPIYSVFAPLGLGLFALILLNSTVKIATGRGVTWKGRAIYERGGVRPPTDDAQTAN